ncbi:phosphatase PAP2 family protein [Desmospora activa]|uniref:Undecaprenyl-diphosphatase n=1 Tax=Desmospora activa DSM 45169 TaxID=1121389 RepID=A0A2T4ZBQ4_9BACL|nr:phosphatase PAP2 family protein [Desmospora activa]PTM59305.1 undecaprenyl-diphosphatase [Desmospora activa DSM 45169]
MKRLAARLQSVDDRWVSYVNQQWKSHTMDWLMPRITHLGGAGFTLLFLAGWWFLISTPSRYQALEAFIALAGSHLVVRLVKLCWNRLRPYLQLSDLHTFPNPLKDYSFPSGHTTAIFSIVVVWILNTPILGVVLLPLACVVGLSRMYLGLHYPTDVAVGAWLGSVSAVLVHWWFPL